MSDVSRHLLREPEAALLCESIQFLPTMSKTPWITLQTTRSCRAALGPKLSEMIIRVKREEWNAFTGQCHSGEIDNYIGAYSGEASYSRR